MSWAHLTLVPKQQVRPQTVLPGSQQAAPAHLACDEEQHADPHALLLKQHCPLTQTLTPGKQHCWRPCGTLQTVCDLGQHSYSLMQLSIIAEHVFGPQHC